MRNVIILSVYMMSGTINVHYAECYYVIMLSVAKLNVVVVNVMAPIK